FSAIAQTLAQAATVQQALLKQNSGITVAFDVGGARSSQPVSVCPYSQLVADARTAAQRMAAAAGLTVGNLLALSDGSPVPTSVVSACLVGVVGIISAPPPPQNCTLTVKFQLIGS